MEQREHSMWGRRTGEVCRRPEPAAIYKRKHGPRSGLPVLPAGPTWHLPPVLLGWVRPPACPLRHRDKGCALSDRTEPVPQAVSPLSSAVACEPGTYFSGESSQCVPCTPGTYQDGDGQLSCTPCPSSDGLGLAGARNVSQCGGECGPSLESGQGGPEASGGSTEVP